MKLYINLNLRSFFKLDNLKSKPSRNKNIIKIKFIIYYMLLIELLNKKSNNKVYNYVFKPMIVKKEKKNSIIYSPNRHKIAQKHFKISQYNTIIPILIIYNSKEIKTKYSIFFYSSLIKLIKSIININLININLNYILSSLKTKINIVEL